jgi:hypothetical protein
VGTIADFITFVARAIVKMGEWITQSKTVTGLLNFLGAGFSALKKFVLEVGKALGGGFIVEVVKAITGAIGKVWDLLNQVKDKIANFFKNLFNVGSRSDFSITTPNLGALQTTVDNNGSLVLPDVGSFMPQVTPTPSPSPRTIVKELPTKTTASASKASITNNYSVTVQALTPTPAVGKVVVDSIKQFQQRSGGALLAI